MSLIDSFKFENSKADPATKVYRLGDLLENRDASLNDLKSLIKNRLEAEDDYLGEILTAYNLSLIHI